MADLNCDLDSELIVIHDASLEEHFKLFDYIIDGGHFSPLRRVKPSILACYACLRGNEYVLRKALKDGIDINEFHDDMSLLMLASEKGHLHIINYLIQEGADVNMVNSLHRTALSMATFCGHVDVVKFLITHGANVQIVEHNGQNLLHLACRTHNLDLFLFLLEQGVNRDMKTIKGNSLLHTAAYDGSKKIVQYLVDHGADLNALNEYDENVFMESVKSGNFETIIYLYNKQKWNINLVNSMGYTMLHLAAFGGNLAIFKYFIQINRSQMNVLNNKLETPLHIAAYHGNLDVVKYLIEHGADHRARSSFNLPPIYSSLHASTTDVLKYLINDFKDDQMYYVDGGGRTLLHFAAFGGRFNAFKLLHENGADINAKTNHQVKPLHYAVKHSHYAIVEYITDHTDEIFDKDAQDNNAMHLAASNGDVTLLEYFHKLDFDINDASQLGTPLHCAVHHGHIEAVKYLISVNANVQAKDKNGNNPYELALVLGKEDVAKAFKEGENDINSTCDDQSVTLSDETTPCRNLDINSSLASTKDNSKVDDIDKKNALFAAAASGNFEVFKSLIGRWAATITDDRGFPLLHVAASIGNLKMIHYMESIEKNFMKKCRTGVTPLYCAVENGHVDVVEHLLKDKNMLKKNRSNETVYHVAAKMGNVEMLKVLHASCKSLLNETSNYGQPLHYAIVGGHTAATVYLIGIGANVNAQTIDSEETPIILATLASDIDIMKILLAKGVNLYLQNKNGNMVMEEAVAQNKIEALKCLAEYNRALLFIINIHGETLLHKAAYASTVATVQFLLDNGLNINAKSFMNVTPLRVAVNNGNNAVVIYLCGKGAMIS